MMPLIIANWKMNVTFEEAIQFCTYIVSREYNNFPIICPPAPYLAYLSNRFKSIKFCAQDVSAIENNGAFTGEYSSLMLKQCFVDYSLTGHSERRELFKESNEIIRQKVISCFNASVIPIICVGEPLEIRQSGSYKEFLLKQLSESLPNKMDFTNKNSIILAYEPIWSIGTGMIPSDYELIETFETIYSFLNQCNIANNVTLVYGGSVNLENIAKILNLKNVSGVLIGKASLDSKILAQMLN